MTTRNVSAATLQINAPRAGGLCAMAWEAFADRANKGKPVVSKDLPGIAESTGLNLTNLRIELSRFNRYCAAHNVYAK